MRWLEKFFGRLRPTFEHKGRLSGFKPLFEAMENFFFAPGHGTVVAPHVRDAIDVKRFMSMVIVVSPSFILNKPSWQASQR